MARDDLTIRIGGMTMTRDELTIWAEARGLSVIDKTEHEELCAKAAAGITAKADLDRDFAALFGPLFG